MDFSVHNEIAATAGGAENFANTQAVAANKRCQIRRIRASLRDPNAGGGTGIFTVEATDDVTAASLAVWRTAIFSNTGPVEDDGDRFIYFSTGANPATITASINADNAGAQAAIAMSGKIQ